ncbi:L,D-transpeptidase family protein [Paenibacillus whitsoniae]|uniref:L,D-transpeptidase family protein n=1 Tax=Paenibacillus whitsoniae TaxID=2496558 RepID=UPI001F4941C4|nr:L,D-transpeptidase [Paenibacillus whitsoniae]
MNERNRNAQLARFFQHNPIEDPLYLKKYVKEHPDNKMAWYLLGREYTAQGKLAKANYCFAQAGEIYEAFEEQKISIDGPLPTAALQEAAAIKRHAAAMERKRGRKTRWLPLLALLFLLAVPAGKEVATSSDLPAAAEPATSPAAAAASAAAGPTARADGPLLYYADAKWGDKLQQIVAGGGAGGGKAVIMSAPDSADGKWREWHRTVRPLVSVAQADSVGGLALSAYQPQVCDCQLADGAPLTPAIQAWMQARETAAVLQSAMEAYAVRNGALPDKPEQLSQPYPNNLLPGVSPGMKEAFPEALKGLQELAKAKGSLPVDVLAEDAGNTSAAASVPQSQAASSSGQPKAATAPLKEPLRILIDTEKHELALVSGRFILRRYPVGLGGDKTPIGDFVISEKVRNPNGKSNGDFGSRGMTLSDTLYAIHGTNKPSSIGKDESHGCVRMQQADVEELYDMVPHGTKVTIGKGILPPAQPGEGGGEGQGAGRGDPKSAFGLPLQTKDDNPGKTYKWLD